MKKLYIITDQFDISSLLVLEDDIIDAWKEVNKQTKVREIGIAREALDIQCLGRIILEKK